MKKITILLSVFIFAFGLKATAQQTVSEHSIYFESAKSELTKESRNILQGIVDSLKNYRTYKISIQGNTDNIGDSAYNKKLSGERVSAARRFFISKGIDSAYFNTAAFGEEKPIAENQSAEGRQKNRRVDIPVSYTRYIPVDSSQFLPSIRDLYRKTEIRPSVFCINNNRDTILRCEKGTLVYVKANSFNIDPSRHGCITLKVKEAFLRSEMILEDLTTTSNGSIIETQGMIYTEANDQTGNKLELKQGKDLVIMMPTDTVIVGAKIFQGNRTQHDSIMNWTVNNSSVLRSFTLKELHHCGNAIIACGFPGYICDCRIICRIMRFDNSIAGLYSNCARFENRVYRTSLRICRLENRGARSRLLSNTNKLERLYAAYPECYTRAVQTRIDQLEPECKQLKELFDQYGVKDYKELLYAVNKELLDSFGVKTREELQDTMAKINKMNIELSYRNKSLNFADFQYYIYNTTRLGWSNIDVFADIPKTNLVTMKINLAAEKNTDCKLVFKNRRFVLPADKDQSKYSFENLPKGEEVWLICLKYLDGKPYLHMEETRIAGKTFEVNFVIYTLEELKEKLKVLDQ